MLLVNKHAFYLNLCELSYLIYQAVRGSGEPL